MISLTKKKRCRPGLLGIEKLGIIYAAFTAVVAAVFYNYKIGRASCRERV